MRKFASIVAMAVLLMFLTSLPAHAQDELKIAKARQDLKTSLWALGGFMGGLTLGLLTGILGTLTLIKRPRFTEIDKALLEKVSDQAYKEGMEFAIREITLPDLYATITRIEDAGGILKRGTIPDPYPKPITQDEVAQHLGKPGPTVCGISPSPPTSAHDQT